MSECLSLLECVDFTASLRFCFSCPSAIFQDAAFFSNSTSLVNLLIAVPGSEKEFDKL